MLRPLLVSASLEGLEPRPRPARPPVPVVRYEQVADRGGVLGALAAALAAGAPARAAVPAGPDERPTWTAGGATGSAVVLFVNAGSAAA